MEPEYHHIASKGGATDFGGSWTLSRDKKSNDLLCFVGKDSYKGYNCVYFGSDNLIGNWHLLTAVFNSGKLGLYIDGLPAAGATTLGSRSFYSKTDAPRIGAVLETANKFLQNWDGSIDEVQIYNRAFTDSERKFACR